MGIRKMTIPLFLTNLPVGLTMTIKSIDADTFKGMYAGDEYLIDLPHTFTTEDTVSRFPYNYHGAKIAEFCLQTERYFGSGNGGSFMLKFSINGRATTCPGAPECNLTAILNISTSEWGIFACPDTMTFAWTLEDTKDSNTPDHVTNLNCTYTHGTSPLGYHQDSCIWVWYDLESKTYKFAVYNEQSKWCEVGE